MHFVRVYQALQALELLRLYVVELLPLASLGCSALDDFLAQFVVDLLEYGGWLPHNVRRVISSRPRVASAVVLC